MQRFLKPVGGGKPWEASPRKAQISDKSVPRKAEEPTGFMDRLTGDDYSAASIHAAIIIECAHACHACMS